MVIITLRETPVAPMNILAYLMLPTLGNSSRGVTGLRFAWLDYWQCFEGVVVMPLRETPVAPVNIPGYLVTYLPLGTPLSWCGGLVVCFVRVSGARGHDGAARTPVSHPTHLSVCLSVPTCKEITVY